jgi:hypothetical protein
MWLDVVLMRSRLPPAQRYLQSVKAVDRPAQAVLPVFFGQSDACLVTRRASEDLVELDPQIGKQLVALATSPPFLPSLMCFRTAYREDSKSVTLESALSLHDKAEGKQVLRLFRTDRLGRFEPSYLDNLLDLATAYDALMPNAKQDSTKKR